MYRFKRGWRIGCSIGLFELWWTQRCSYENTSGGGGLKMRNVTLFREIKVQNDE